MHIKSLRQVRKLRERPVLVRCNFDVPIEVKKGAKIKVKITDDYKIITALPTIRYLRRYGAKILLLSHWGRPKRHDPTYSLAPIAKYLTKVLGWPVKFCPAAVGTQAEQAAQSLARGEVLLLENVRFYPGETANSAYFARRLAQLAPKGIYVNDAFSVSHRNHASVSAIKKFLPSYAGLLLEKEVKNLSSLQRPRRLAVAVMGGAKISTKLKVIKKLVKNFDYILLGGAMANNVLAARGFEVGKSLVKAEEIDLAHKLRSRKIILPQDVVVNTRKDGGGKTKIKEVSQMSRGDAIFDIGPATILAYTKIIKQARTIVWNGPLGKFEQPAFRHGTIALARIIASRASGKAFAVVGGGDTVAALRASGMDGYIDWVSTGGGAMLAFLGGEKMPGLSRIIEK